MNKVQTECPHCHEFVWVWYTRADKGNTYGPPEKCSPPWPAELEPNYPDCEHCGEEFDDDDVEKMLERVEEDQSNWADMERERNDEY